MYSQSQMTRKKSFGQKQKKDWKEFLMLLHSSHHWLIENRYEYIYLSLTWFQTHEHIQGAEMIKGLNYMVTYH